MINHRPPTYNDYQTVTESIGYGFQVEHGVPTTTEHTRSIIVQ